MSFFWYRIVNPNIQEISIIPNDLNLVFPLLQANHWRWCSHSCTCKGRKKDVVRGERNATLANSCMNFIKGIPLIESNNRVDVHRWRFFSVRILFFVLCSYFVGTHSSCNQMMIETFVSNKHRFGLSLMQNSPQRLYTLAFFLFLFLEYTLAFLYTKEA